MIDLIGKNILIDAITKVLEIIKNNNSNKHRERELLIIAITSIDQAIIETKNFIKIEGYKPNMQLAGLWNQALNNSVKANLRENIPD